MIDPVVYQYVEEWTAHKPRFFGRSSGAYKLRYGTIEVHGDRDVPKWCRQASPNEAGIVQAKATTPYMMVNPGSASTALSDPVDI